MSNQPARDYFPAIDYLRLVCAVGVVLFHLAYASMHGGLARYIITPGLSIQEGDWFRHGWVGVQIFFVISGFVIAESAGAASAWGFMRRRAERLYPAVWICAPVSALIWLVFGRDPTTTLLLLAKSLALIPGGEWIDAPYWTLGCEVGFYLVVFVVLVAAGGGKLHGLAVALAAVSTAFWFFYWLELKLGLRIGASIFAGLKPLPVYYGAYFALGMLLYFRKSGRGSRINLSAIVCCIAVAMIESSQIATRLQAASAVPPLLFLIGLGVIAWAKPVAGTRPLSRLCGLTTYPLYLLHFALGLVCVEFLIRAGFGGFSAALLAAAAMIACAMGIAIWLEPLVRRRMARTIDGIEPIVASKGPAWLFNVRA